MINHLTFPATAVREENKAFLQRLLGLLQGMKVPQIGQYLTRVFPVTIPETIEGRISAPVPFSLDLSLCLL